MTPQALSFKAYRVKVKIINIIIIILESCCLTDDTIHTGASEDISKYLSKGKMQLPCIKTKCYSQFYGPNFLILYIIL